MFLQHIRAPTLLSRIDQTSRFIAADYLRRLQTGIVGRRNQSDMAAKVQSYHDYDLRNGPSFYVDIGRLYARGHGRRLDAR